LPSTLVKEAFGRCKIDEVEDRPEAVVEPILCPEIGFIDVEITLGG
jgi:hypothetical protein